MLRLAFDFIITWRETRTRPNAYNNKFQFPIPLYRHYIHKYKLYFGNQS